MYISPKRKMSKRWTSKCQLQFLMFASISVCCVESRDFLAFTSYILFSQHKLFLTMLKWTKLVWPQWCWFKSLALASLQQTKSWRWKSKSVRHRPSFTRFVFSILLYLMCRFVVGVFNVYLVRHARSMQPNMCMFGNCVDHECWTGFPLHHITTSVFPTICLSAGWCEI